MFHDKRFQILNFSNFNTYQTLIQPFQPHFYAIKAIEDVKTWKPFNLEKALSFVINGMGWKINQPSNSVMMNVKGQQVMDVKDQR